MAGTELPASLKRMGMATLGMAMLLSACAGTAPAPSGSTEGTSLPAASSNANDCAFARLVHDWTALDDMTLILYATRETEAYLAKITQPTPDLRYAVGVAVLDVNHDGLICGDHRDAITFGRHGVIPGKFTITSMRKLAPGEAQELIDRSEFHAKDRHKQKPAEPAPEQSR